jgi:DNA-binding IclR family transcriptional regulator
MAGGARSEDRRSVAQKLFAIAEALEGGRRLTLSEVARRAGLPLSTTHRLLAEWTEWGGVERGDDGRYSVGLRMWRLGVRQPTARRLSVLARPYLDDLLEATGEHVHLAVRDGLGATYLERLSGRDPVTVISGVGAKLPLHATGVGLVLLAFAPSDVLEAVLAAGPVKYQPETLTTEPELRAQLAEIRATGLSRSVNALTPGAFSIAAPVLGHTGQVVAAVSIVARTDRMDEPQFAFGVRMAARGISSALGWHST